MARTTDDPREHFVGVRLTDAEHRALALLAKQRGDRYLSDALRSLIATLLEPAKEQDRAARRRSRRTGTAASIPPSPGRWRGRCVARGCRGGRLAVERCRDLVLPDRQDIALPQHMRPRQPRGGAVEISAIGADVVEDIAAVAEDDFAMPRRNVEGGIGKTPVVGRRAADDRAAPVEDQRER